MAQRSSSPRTHHAFECDHMRPVVFCKGAWHHVLAGNVVSECSAAVYRVDATYEGEHYVRLHARITHDSPESLYIPLSDDGMAEVGHG